MHNIYSFFDKKSCFQLLFFIKVASMFKLLVILFIIKTYTPNDIFKYAAPRKKLTPKKLYL